VHSTAGIVAAVANHDTPALFRWLLEIISHQGIAAAHPIF